MRDSYVYMYAGTFWGAMYTYVWACEDNLMYFSS